VKEKIITREKFDIISNKALSNSSQLNILRNYPDSNMTIRDVTQFYFGPNIS
jgi:hypothetical protein